VPWVSHLRFGALQISSFQFIGIGSTQDLDRGEWILGLDIE
jgi:hypothetical protein